MASVRVNMTFTEEMHNQLHTLSNSSGLPIAYIVREAVGDYLKAKGQAVEHIHPNWGGFRRESSDTAGT